MCPNVNCRSWSAARDVSAMVTRPDWGWVATTFSGIQLRHQPAASGRNGRLIVCCDHQDHHDFTNGNTTWSYSHVLVSDDGGTRLFWGSNFALFFLHTCLGGLNASRQLKSVPTLSFSPVMS